MSSNSVATVDIAITEATSFGIAELSKEFDVTPRALRFYEEEGLIAPTRDGATRIYSRRDRVRIALILRGKNMGFSLDEIGELLDLYDVGDDGATQRAVTALRCRAKMDTLRRQADEIQTMIDHLGHFADRLEAKRG